MRPLLLDLFCGAGGAAAGYHRAGWDVVGVDIHPQPRYPFPFIQADAFSLPVDLRAFTAIHASPPCQAYSQAGRDRHRHPDLYEACRARLTATGLPWVIENVVGAPYRSGIRLCGTMFGLDTGAEWLRRHRNFESSELLLQPQCRHRADVRAVSVYGHGTLRTTRDYGTGRFGTLKLARQLMGIDWMTRAELGQAVPPAYTEYIGRELLAVLGRGPECVPAHARPGFPGRSGLLYLVKGSRQGGPHRGKEPPVMSTPTNDAKVIRVNPRRASAATRKANATQAKAEPKKAAPKKAEPKAEAPKIARAAGGDKVSISISTELKDWFRAYATEHGMTASAALNHALTTFRESAK